MRARIVTAYLMTIILMLALSPVLSPMNAARHAQNETNWEERFRSLPQAERL